MSTNGIHNAGRVGQRVALLFRWVSLKELKWQDQDGKKVEWHIYMRLLLAADGNKLFRESGKVRNEGRGGLQV